MFAREFCHELACLDFRIVDLAEIAISPFRPASAIATALRNFAVSNATNASV
jgi:hypothetical protein